jgi:hypothetical protein
MTRLANRDTSTKPIITGTSMSGPMTAAKGRATVDPKCRDRNRNGKFEIVGSSRKRKRRALWVGRSELPTQCK